MLIHVNISACLQSFVPGLVTNITDLTSPDQIDLLPVKILKIILQRNCINYKGCVEKEELKDRVKRLWIAREKAKALEDKIAGDLGIMIHEMYLFYNSYLPLSHPLSISFIIFFYIIYRCRE